MSAFRRPNVVEIDLCVSDVENDVAQKAAIPQCTTKIMSAGRKRSPNSLSDVPLATTSGVSGGGVVIASSRGETGSSAGIIYAPNSNVGGTKVSASAPVVLGKVTSRQQRLAEMNEDNTADYVNFSNPLVSSCSSSSSSSMPVRSKNDGVPSIAHGKNTKTVDIDLTSDSVSSAPTKPSMYLEIVTSVFPDAKINHVTQLLDKYMNDVDSVVQHMIANGYERVEVINVVKAKELDFRSTSWVTSDTYREVASNALCNDFPFIQRKSILKIFETHRFGLTHSLTHSLPYSLTHSLTHYSHHYYPSLAWLEKELNIER